MPNAQHDGRVIRIGRRTFEPMAAAGRGSMPGMKTIVFSRTLRSDDNPGVLIVAEDEMKTLASLKASSGKDIWLFGGASLVTTFMNEGLVDELELAIHPILLGSGKPLFQNIDKRIKLQLTNSKVYDSGLVQLFYNVLR